MIEKSATEMAAALQSGELSSVELTKAHLARIDEVDGKVKAFLHIDKEGALHIDRSDEIIAATLMCSGGEVVRKS